MNLVVIVPTYWTWSDGPRADDDAVFDHPTPLGTRGTLGRTLESFHQQSERDFRLLVVAASTSPSLAEETREAVSTIFEGSDSGVPVSLFAQREIGELHQRLEEDGHGELSSLASLAGYGQVRNAGFLAAQIGGADAVLLIDDDEVLEDVDFIRKVRHHLDEGVEALAGYYVNADGTFLLPESSELWQVRWGKTAAMNQAFRSIIGPSPRRGLRRTPFAFGGNMAMSRRLYSAVPFDPNITRGEDIDYLINTRLAGFEGFVLDRSLAVKHLPPPHSQPAWSQLRQDALRFLYEREKLAGAGVDPAELDPYPGPFLRSNLRERLDETCRLLSRAYEQCGDSEAVAHVTELRREVQDFSFPRAFARYENLRDRWCRLMNLLLVS